MTKVRPEQAMAARQARPQWWKGLAVFVAAAAAAHLLAHTPISTRIDEQWLVMPNQRLTLRDPASELIFSAKFRGTASVPISSGPRASLVDPNPDQIRQLAQELPSFAAPPPNSGIEIRLANGEKSTAFIAIRLKQKSQHASVEISPKALHGQNALNFSPRGAALVVSLDWSSEPPVDAQSGPLLLGSEGELPVGHAKILVPDGESIAIGFSKSATSYADFGLQQRLASQSAGIDVSAVEIGSGTQGSPEVRGACAANAPNHLRLPIFIGGLGYGNCAGQINLSQAKLGDELRFVASGSAFSEKAGEVDFFPLFDLLNANPVIKDILPLVFGAITAYVAWNLGLKKQH